MYMHGAWQHCFTVACMRAAALARPRKAAAVGDVRVRGCVRRGPARAPAGAAGGFVHHAKRARAAARLQLRSKAS